MRRMRGDDAVSGRAPTTIPPRADWRPMLAARPYRNVAAEVEPTDDGGVRIAIRKADARWRRRPWKWFVPGRDRRLITLDRIGCELWELCDGRAVEDIIEEMARRHRLSFHEARVSATGLLRDLIRRGALAIALTANAGADQKIAR